MIPSTASTSKPNSIELDVAKLVEVRAALRNEMDKIASVVSHMN